ncbi:MAG: cytochrome c3 family protein, partial [Candidatus Binatia bacterium]
MRTPRCIAAVALAALPLLVHALRPPAVLAEGAETGEVAVPAVSEALKGLFEAEDDAGTPVVGEAERLYFDALPAHARQLFADAVDGEFISSPAQARDLLSLGLDTAKLESILTNNCLLCHSNPDFQEAPTLFSLDPQAAGSPEYMDLKLLLSDAHLRHNLSCAGCHGGDPSGDMDHDHPDQWPADHDERVADPKWIPAFCSRCHSDATLMGRFNPALPTDQLAKYETSHHGRALLKEGNVHAAQCVSCHGVHGIQSASNPASSVSAKRVPETCGKCHSDAKLMAGVTLDDGSPM